MPLLQSSYHPPVVLRNYHITTIYAAVVRKVEVPQMRQRLELADGDFLDLDWSFSSTPTKKVVLLVHGLEGSSRRPYIRGAAKLFSESGWDVAAINLRGCSGEINRRFKSYHAGATGDLDQVVNHVLQKQKYKSICFNGFSLGANLMLKYLGEGRPAIPELKAAVMVSAPCDLYGSLRKLEETRNLLYRKRFLYKLKKNLLLRAQHFPERITTREIAACDSLLSIDNLYTSKAHGYKNALDYYEKNSALQFLDHIEIPTLILNAGNDGFLSEESYPREAAARKKNLYLEIPQFGGHTAFLQKKEPTYNEERAFQFMEDFCP